VGCHVPASLRGTVILMYEETMESIMRELTLSEISEVVGGADDRACDNMYSIGNLEMAAGAAAGAVAYTNPITAPIMAPTAAVLGGAGGLTYMAGYICYQV